MYGRSADSLIAGLKEQYPDLETEKNASKPRSKSFEVSPSNKEQSLTHHNRRQMMTDNLTITPSPSGFIIVSSVTAPNMFTETEEFSQNYYLNSGSYTVLFLQRLYICF